MATTWLCGFESGETADASNERGEFSLFLGTPIVQSTTVRSGTYAGRINVSASVHYWEFGLGAATLFMSCRFYLRVASLPSGANCKIAHIRLSDNPQQSLWLDTDGKLTLGIGSSTRTVTSTNALTADGLWHLIEFDNGWSSGNGQRVYVDGVEWASTVTGTPVLGTVCRIGVAQNSATADLYFDDVVLDNASLSALWDDYNVIWLPVISDNTINTWVGGAGGTSNLFEAVNNIPPVAVQAGSDTDTSQMLCATNPGTAYDGNVQSYTTAGIGAADTIKAVVALAVTGEGVTTGTKTGALSIVSNPAATARTFNYGNNEGQATTYPVLWAPVVSEGVDAPSVTLGTSPVVRITKTDTGTREAHCAWLGIYVAYTPGVAGTLVHRQLLMGVGI